MERATAAGRLDCMLHSEAVQRRLRMGPCHQQAEVPDRQNWFAVVCLDPCMFSPPEIRAYISLLLRFSITAGGAASTEYKPESCRTLTSGRP